MTVLADFSVIIGDGPEGQGVEVPSVPWDQIEQGSPVKVGPEFQTAGRISSATETGGDAAFLTFSVQGVGIDAPVFINQSFVDKKGQVGLITPTHSVGWETQIITIAGIRLGPGWNQIWVKATDRFRIKDLICFYHQDSD